jgi:hypothetical protein
MTSAPDHTSPAPIDLWKHMSEEQKLRAAEAFWREKDSRDQQIEAMALLAQKLKARPKFVSGLPIERKAWHLAHFPGMSDVLAARLLVSYHLAHQRPMMAAFLDAIGIGHEDGLITTDVEGPLDAERLAAGATALRAAYPPSDVHLYFGTLLVQDPETWSGLEGLMD